LCEMSQFYTLWKPGNAEMTLFPFPAPSIERGNDGHDPST
jgi:hypothetical protein